MTGQAAAKPGCSGGSWGRGRVDPATSSEATQDRPPVAGHQHVRRVDATVHHADVVEVGHGLRERGNQSGGALDRHRTECVERMGPHELRRQHGSRVVVCTAHEPDHIRMLFTEETLSTLCWLKRYLDPSDRVDAFPGFDRAF